MSIEELHGRCAAIFSDNKLSCLKSLQNEGKLQQAAPNRRLREASSRNTPSNRIVKENLIGSCIEG
jgi:hypothetical protein